MTMLYHFLIGSHLLMIHCFMNKRIRRDHPKCIKCVSYLGRATLIGNLFAFVRGGFDIVSYMSSTGMLNNLLDAMYVDMFETVQKLVQERQNSDI